jgi:hypothetical protein
MADERIPDLSGGTITVLADADQFIGIDKGDTSEDPDGTNKNLVSSTVRDYVLTGLTVEGTAITSTGETGGVKYLREDGDGTCSWQAVVGGGDVSKVGTPVDKEIGIWTGDGTIKGSPEFQFDTDTNTLSLGGSATFGVEKTETPTGTTTTVDLREANHQTRELGSTTGDVTITFTPPIGSTVGSLIVHQHAATARDITWVVTGGTVRWLGTEPTWNADAVGSWRVVTWRWDGTNMFFATPDSTG